ncbi:MAG TPA: inositol monophosphatase family protein [Candidatus Sulfotelmatobacter sp.]
MAEPSTGEILNFALSLCEQAGRLILPLWKNVAVDHKTDGSEVTDADRGAEKLLRNRIAEQYPTHAILGEEFGGQRSREAEHLWLIDPVDGTASFAIGLPLFGTLIGYLRRGEPCVGVIAAHALGEAVYAASGQGCWHQRGNSPPKHVRTSTVTEVRDAFVVSTTLEDSDMDPRNPKPSVCLSRLYRQSRRFRWSGDCVNYSLLCQGSIDVAVDTRVNPWDVAAVTPCVREAGGVITSLDGKDDAVWQTDVVASANAKLHAKVLESLRER